MKKYVSYEKTNIPWIHERPSHWNEFRGKRLFVNNKEKNFNNVESNVLSLTLKGVIRNDKDKPIGLSPNDYSSYQIFEKDDLVFKLIDLENISTSRVGIVPERGIMSSAYIRLTARTDVNIRYFYLQYYALWLRNIYNGLGAGVRQTLSSSELLNLGIVVPPKEEQDQIVRFLDWKISSINQLINTKKKEIDRLKELKLCMITNAVLHGVSDEGTILNPRNDNRWEKVRIGYKAWIRARLGWRGLKATEYVDEGYPFLSAFNIVDDKLVWEDLNFINRYRYDESPEIKLSVGDILLVKDGAGIGKCARVDELPYGESTPNGSLALITPDGDLDYRYLYYYLISNDFKNSMNKIITGMGVPHLTQHFLKNVEIPCPPVEIQKRVADFLDAEIGKVDAFIINIKSSVEELQEYRSRLISDVVTGQVDVRNIVVPEYEYVEECSDADSDSDDESEDVSNEEV